MKDAKAIVRLLGQIAGADIPLVNRKRLLMDGLMRLTKADGWFWSLTQFVEGQIRPVLIWMIHGGWSDVQITGYIKSMHASGAQPEDGPIGRELESWKHITRTRQQLISDEQWYSNPIVREGRLNLGLDHYVYSIYPMTIGANRVLSFMGLYRNVGGDPFSDRDRRIMHIVASEIDWLHHAGVPEDHGTSIPLLPPRRRMVLNLLLEGHDRKSIAQLLGITPNTAKQHIKAVYELYRVTSQVELICRFRRGDGRDVA